MAHLPEPEACNWYEAEDYARVLSQAAADLYVLAGERPTGRFQLTAKARWYGMHSAVNALRFRAMAYHRRKVQVQNAEGR